MALRHLVRRKHSCNVEPDRRTEGVWDGVSKASQGEQQQLCGLHTVDGRNPAPPKKPGMMIPLEVPEKNIFPWFPSGARFRPSTVSPFDLSCENAFSLPILLRALVGGKRHHDP